MMKKLLIFPAAVLLAAGLFFGQASQSTTFNLSLYLNEYIETMPGPVSWNLGSTSHDAANNVETGYTLTDNWDLAYANCPFTLTISGDNPAGEGKPRFARMETGAHAIGYDTLPTVYGMWVTVNGVTEHATPWWYQGAGAFPYSAHYTEAPHDGQVKMYTYVWVNYAHGITNSDPVPLRQTLNNPAFTWQDSADAGVYTCALIVTLGAL